MSLAIAKNLALGLALGRALGRGKPEALGRSLSSASCAHWALLKQR